MLGVERTYPDINSYKTLAEVAAKIEPRYHNRRYPVVVTGDCNSHMRNVWGPHHTKTCTEARYRCFSCRRLGYVAASDREAGVGGHEAHQGKDPATKERRNREQGKVDTQL
eukprot:Blabericola_migrator_1__3262@NODE_195_length_11539_cov_221_635547_g168_i0_p12_GENE_NODE_195_length_11539_cov_221_635547_g168_i0NODE_195_length_11539_cov_221_635547_g168_i0_p12_ORF_typecomplete_len111_score10_10Exo_endo_phos_2/PF14529_6/0_11_NODE_195_length_11539_cov_221_635547_g168_i083668698